MKPTLPIIDFTPLVRGQGDPQLLAIAISEACRDAGFFYITGHGVSVSLQNELTRLARTDSKEENPDQPS
jgi:isopenicillin N synthase-like dioxygenase